MTSFNDTLDKSKKNELYFWFVESGYLNGKERKDENKNRQYIMVIDKNLLKGGK